AVAFRKAPLASAGQSRGIKEDLLRRQAAVIVARRRAGIAALLEVGQCGRHRDGIARLRQHRDIDGLTGSGQTGRRVAGGVTRQWIQPQHLAVKSQDLRLDARHRLGKRTGNQFAGQGRRKQRRRGTKYRGATDPCANYPVHWAFWNFRTIWSVWPRMSDSNTRSL